MSSNHEIQYFLRMRIVELTKEVHTILDTPNMPNDRLMVLIAEIIDLEGQLEFVVAKQPAVIDLTDDEVYEYDIDDFSDKFFDPPELCRQVAGYWMNG